MSITISDKDFALLAAKLARDEARRIFELGEWRNRQNLANLRTASDALRALCPHTSFDNIVGASPVCAVCGIAAEQAPLTDGGASAIL